MEVNALDLNDTNKVPELDLSTLNNQQNYISDADFTQAMKRLAGVPMNTPVSEISALQRYQDEVDLMQATESNLTSGKIDADMAYKAMNAGTIAGAADTLTSEKAVLTRAAAENLVSIKLQNDDTYRINPALNKEGDIYPEYLVARQLYADWWLEEQREKHKGGTGRKLIQRALVPFVAGFGGSAIATAGAASGNSLATVLGTSIVEGGDAGWDMYMLGDTLHHVQEDARQRFVDIVYDYNKTPDQVIKDLNGLSQYLDRYPDSYLEEIYEGMEQGATNYAGFGNFFGGASLVASGKIITAPIKTGRSIVSGVTPRFIKRALNKHLPDRFKSAEYVAENMDIDKGLEKKVDQIYQEKSTVGTSEEVAKEKIKETTKTDTPQETIEAAKGVERNKQIDATNSRANSETSINVDTDETIKMYTVTKRGTDYSMTSEEADKTIQKINEESIQKEWDDTFGNMSIDKIKSSYIVNNFEKKTYENKINSGMSEKQAILETINESIERDSQKLNATDSVSNKTKRKNKLDKHTFKMYDSNENGYKVVEEQTFNFHRPWNVFSVGVGYDYNAEGLKSNG